MRARKCTRQSEVFFANRIERNEYIHRHNGEGRGLWVGPKKPQQVRKCSQLPKIKSLLPSSLKINTLLPKIPERALVDFRMPKIKKKYHFHFSIFIGKNKKFCRFTSVFHGGGTVVESIPKGKNLIP